KRHPPRIVEAGCGANIVKAFGGCGGKENLADLAGRAKLAVSVSDGDRVGRNTADRARLAQPFGSRDHGAWSFGPGITFEDAVGAEPVDPGPFEPERTGRRHVHDALQRRKVISLPNL